MTRPSPVHQVLEMVRLGQITKEQGDHLLDALQAAPHPLSRVLFSPFERIGLGLSLVIGAAVAVASASLMLLHVHFDGILDVHFVERKLLLKEIAVEQLLAWPFLALLLWLTARIVERRGRLVDFLAHTGVARAPMFLAGLGGGLLFNAFQWLRPGQPIPDQLGLAGFGWAILCNAWNIALLYQGYRTASGGRGTRAVVSFILVLVAAEIVGEIVLAALPLRS